MTTQTTELPKQETTMKKLINELYSAFDFFNYELFNNLLPHCAIVITEKRGAKGVYYAEKFVDTNDDYGQKMDQILLNPVDFNRSVKDILSTLVHEMVHQWEHEYGNPPKGSYHNRPWAESMKSMGLYPSTTGEPGGAETGRKCSHYIIDGGLFDQAADKFIEKYNFNIEWVVIESQRKPGQRKKTYRCGCPQPWYTNLSGRQAKCLECNEEFMEDE